MSGLPSAALPVQGVGRARWRLELIRCRAAESADLEVEGCDAKGRLALLPTWCHSASKVDPRYVAINLLISSRNIYFGGPIGADWDPTKLSASCFISAAYGHADGGPPTAPIHARRRGIRRNARRRKRGTSLFLPSAPDHSPPDLGRNLFHGRVFHARSRGRSPSGSTSPAGLRPRALKTAFTGRQPLF